MSTRDPGAVTCCRWCPFVRWNLGADVPVTSDGACTLPGGPDEVGMADSAAPPDCPLRKAPVLVHLEKP
jgi:hypothetical protein